MHRLSLLILLFPILLNAQTRIDGDFPFDTDPEKKYSIYIPSEYNSEVPHKVMLALHPFNTDRWDAESWCDTLVDFAEENQLILICPDGGEDGQIDDPIDTAFTSVLIDSMTVWYNLNFDKFYGMGFSWGARGIYTYGLTHGDLIKGYIPIGAAINGTSEVNEALQLNASEIPFYIIHGNLDAPSIRFFPIRDSLISKGAIVETNLMDGVGHTIDFPNRNMQLGIAFEWIDSVNCSSLSLVKHLVSNDFGVYPNPVQEGQPFMLEAENINGGPYHISVRNVQGKIIAEFTKNLNPGLNIIESPLPKGQFFVQISNGEKGAFIRLVVD